jgi:hypothetical protein
MKSVGRLLGGSITRATIEAIICDQCQTECWHLEVWAIGDDAGEQWKSCILYADHLARSEALLMLGGLTLRAGSIRAGDESRAWMLEHQQTLW